MVPPEIQDNSSKRGEILMEITNSEHTEFEAIRKLWTLPYELGLWWNQAKGNMKGWSGQPFLESRAGDEVQWGAKAIGSLRTEQGIVITFKRFSLLEIMSSFGVEQAWEPQPEIFNRCRTSCRRFLESERFLVDYVDIPELQDSMKEEGSFAVVLHQIDDIVLPSFTRCIPVAGDNRESLARFSYLCAKQGFVMRPAVKDFLIESGLMAA